jgi:hypothetical protein
LLAISCKTFPQERVSPYSDSKLLAAISGASQTNPG